MKITSQAVPSAVITTYTGRHVDLLWPELAEIAIDDIAYALAANNRFNGHTVRPYSVAEHCLLGVEFCVPSNRLEFLMHDASEAYLGDIVGPLKATVMFEPYCKLEAQWADAIALRFGLQHSTEGKLAKEIHSVDRRMLVTEQRDLMGRRPRSTDAYKPFPLAISAVTPCREALAEKFLAKFYELVPLTVGAKR